MTAQEFSVGMMKQAIAGFERHPGEQGMLEIPRDFWGKLSRLGPEAVHGQLCDDEQLSERFASRKNSELERQDAFEAIISRLSSGAVTRIKVVNSGTQPFRIVPIQDEGVSSAGPRLL